MWKRATYEKLLAFFDKLEQVKAIVLFIKLKNRRRDVISLNQPWDMSTKMAANGIRTHACTNQRRTQPMPAPTRDVHAIKLF